MFKTRFLDLPPLLAAGGTVKIGVTADGKELALTTLPTETPALPATLQ